MPRLKSFDEQEVLNKAMELFWKKGYLGTSIQDLVNHLKINRASLYDTYGGKKALFLKSLDKYQERHKSTFYELLHSQPQVRQGLRNLFEYYVRKNPDRKGCFVVNMTTEMVPADKSMQLRLRENQRFYENLFFNYLKSGEAMGEIPRGKDLKTFANLLFTLYNGIQVISKIESAPSRQLAVVDTALKFLD
ncbi:MAG: TetR/AcrR family transcriptional regulator [Cyclobacteriaceae bacterium]